MCIYPSTGLGLVDNFCRRPTVAVVPEPLPVGRNLEGVSYLTEILLLGGISGTEGNDGGGGNDGSYFFFWLKCAYVFHGFLSGCGREISPG